MENDLISIIVPCYNVEEYVQKCINSLLRQTYYNVEIIAVNDGSTDNTLILLNKLKKVDNRLIIISQNNEGLSSARNTGLKYCKGKYVCFVDSDDYVDENYIKKLYTAIKDKDGDISICDYYYVDEYNEIWENEKRKIENVYTNIEALKDMFSGSQKLEVMTWNKLYKKSLFIDNNIKFPIGKLHEDNYTTYKLFYYSKNIVLIKEKLYYYLQRKNSIMGKKFNHKRLDIIGALNETKEFIYSKQEKKLYKYYFAYENLCKMSLINNMIRGMYEKNEIVKLQKEIKSSFFKYIFNPIIRVKLKLEMIILVSNLEIYEKIICRKEK